MRVNPKTEEEIQLMSLMAPGVYDFEVVDAKEKVSKSGNEMIELTLTVWDINGKPHTIYDYLLDAMAYKVRHFAEAANLLDKYLAGSINADDCRCVSAKVEIIIQKGGEKFGGGTYPDKNSVKDYIVKKGNFSVVPSIKEIAQDTFNDDIPF
jgi:hypothetical protein